MFIYTEITSYLVDNYYAEWKNDSTEKDGETAEQNQDNSQSDDSHLEELDPERNLNTISDDEDDENPQDSSVSGNDVEHNSDNETEIDNAEMYHSERSLFSDLESD